MKKQIDLVMLIDDNEASNNLSQILIEDLGCASEIVAKQTAVEALEYLENNENSVPDLILLDINMPIMNGWEFIDEFKILNSVMSKSPVIIMVSTSLNPDDQK
ncbi:MAG: response regulator, partial [Bacteroidia bacterium]|nr:response regulator [Bacteroidia bacterium]